MLDVPSFSYGIGETWDAELEVPSVSINLDNADGLLGPYVIGCALGAVAASAQEPDNRPRLGKSPDQPLEPRCPSARPPLAKACSWRRTASSPPSPTAAIRSNQG
jgi:hypothetical protein